MVCPLGPDWQLFESIPSPFSHKNLYSLLTNKDSYDRR